MNLNAASVLRDQIDDMLVEDTGLEGTDSSILTGGLPVSLDINEGIHSLKFDYHRYNDNSDFRSCYCF